MTQKYIEIHHASALTAEVLFALKDLDQKYFPTPWDSESWDQVMGTSQSRFILLQQDNQNIPGFILYDINVVDSFAHLLKILVNPESRGLKIGKALLSESIRVLKDRGIKNFFLEVEEDNVVARSLYESAGFQVIHKKKHFYNNGAAALIMTMGV